MSGKLVLLVERLGPYHVARLERLAQHTRLAVVEVCSRDDTYAWAQVPLSEAVERCTLFQDAASARNVTVLRREVERTLDRLAPSVLFYPGWSDPAALCMLRYSRQRGVPGVMMSDSTALDSRRVWLREYVKTRLVALADAMFVAGTRHVEYAEQLGMPVERIATGYDVVDNDHFAKGASDARRRAAELRRAHRLPERYFVACARFVEKKNWVRLLSAYADYRQVAGEQTFGLVAVGDGPLAPALRALAAERGIGEHVRFVGFWQYQALPVVYGLASALIHASTVDQWGLVVNEALAAGLPVLVSNRSGCAPDLVREGENGWTFDPTDVGSLTALMKRVGRLSDQERAELGAHGQALIAEWSLDRFASGALSAASMAKREFAKNQLTKRPSLVDTALLRVLAEQRSA